MATKKKAKSADNPLKEIILDAISDVKGERVVELDMRGLEEAPADIFIVCQGNSNTQVQAIAASIQKSVKDKLGEFAEHLEGVENGEWVLVDYFDIVVHIFHPKTREFYNLENLWSDAIVREYETL